MLVEKNVPLQALNTFHIVARAHGLVRVRNEADVLALSADRQWAQEPKFVLGGGSNLVLTGDVKPLVLKVEVQGRSVVGETAKAWIVEAGAGEDWHDFVAWTLAQGLPGLENLALIPGTVGASPVQNIGAYGVELQDRFESLDAIDLTTGKLFTLDAAQCAFGYRDSIFKHGGTAPLLGLKDRALILRVRFALPKIWKPVLGYADLEKKQAQAGCDHPTAQQIFDWVCDIRRAKLPDPAVIGNAGSFFQNPIVSTEQCEQLSKQFPNLVSYPDDNGKRKLAAGWLIDQCGFKGKRVGPVGVYEKQALVLVNHGGGTSTDILNLAKSIQEEVLGTFGVRLEIEPNIL